MDGEVDWKAKAVWRRILSARGTRRPGQYVFRRHGHWLGRRGRDHERKDLRRTASLFRRDGEFTFGSTATESAGVIKVVAFIPMGPRMEDAMYSSYGIPVTLVSTRPRSSKAIFEYVDLALGAKRGFRFLTAVIRSAGISWGGETRQNRDLPASEQGLYSS